MTIKFEELDGFYAVGRKGTLLGRKAEVILREIEDQDRWHTYGWTVVRFEDNGELMGFDWARGSTEYQEVDEPEEVDLYPVEPYQKTAYRRAQA